MSGTERGDSDLDDDIFDANRQNGRKKRGAVEPAPQLDAPATTNDGSIFQSYLQSQLPEVFEETREPQVQVLQVMQQDSTEFLSAENARLRETVRRLREENRIVNGQKEAYRARLESLREMVSSLEQKIEETLFHEQLPAALFGGLVGALSTFAGIHETLVSV